MKTAIITGANGFIGTNLIKRLTQEGIYIYAFINKSELLKEKLSKNPNVKVLRCNLEELSKNQFDFPDNADVMYHLAWKGVKPDERKNFELQLKNLTLTLNALKIAKEKKIKRFVMPGSTNEYLYSGEAINAKTIPSPRDAYGSVKVALRYLAKQYATENQIEFIYAVITGIYSEQRKDNNVISYTIDKLLKNESPALTRLEQYWDYVHIDDVSEALYLIGEKGKSGQLYAIGHGDNWPLKKYIEIISKKINKNIHLGIGDIPYSSPELPMSCIDLTDLKNDTGFLPKISFEEGISRMISNWNNI